MSLTIKSGGKFRDGQEVMNLLIEKFAAGRPSAIAAAMRLTANELAPSHLDET